MLERMVLRAEVVHASRRIIAHTTQLTDQSVFVRTDEPLDIGDHVVVELSFPRFLAPIQLEASVSAKDPGNGHGYAAGVTLGYAATDQQRAAIALLLRDPVDAPPTGGEPATCRILVVEDSAVMRDLVQIGAERYAARPVRLIVDTADTAEHALELVRATSYDLALVDLYLPGPMSGAELVHSVRATDHADLPVIGFSVGGAAARAAFLAAGADLFLDKPVMVKDVFATLERLMMLRAWRVT